MLVSWLIGGAVGLLLLVLKEPNDPNDPEQA